jgi:DNA-directed RNA polymerase subunit RPC12/RpoP
MDCNFCTGKMKVCRNKDTLLPISNPRTYKTKATFYKCIDCGKELFGKEEIMRLSKEIDKINDKLEKGNEEDIVKIEDGKIIV